MGEEETNSWCLPDSTKDYVILISIILFAISELLPFTSSLSGNGLLHQFIVAIITNNNASVCELVKTFIKDEN